jgi:hypothetical protein
MSACLPRNCINEIAKARGIAVRVARRVAVPETFMETSVMLRIYGFKLSISSNALMIP